MRYLHWLSKLILVMQPAAVTILKREHGKRNFKEWARKTTTNISKTACYFFFFSFCFTI